MFVQSSHFIEADGGDTIERATFHGPEKSETTARLAQINLAAHGPVGKIRAGNEARKNSNANCPRLQADPGQQAVTQRPGSRRITRDKAPR